MKKSILISLLIFFSYNNDLLSQKRKNAKQELSFNENLYNSINYRLIGPFRGGRAGTATGIINDSKTYYMGTAGGGVWKTVDAGNTWKCISDGFFGGSIGAIAVAESDPNIIYVGEGEQTLRGNVSSGKGIWKSLDAGETWKYLGLPKSEHISRIRIHPKNPEIVYVAVIGNLWKSNRERGLYKSTNGGKNWKKILYVSEKAGIGDLILDPNNSRILYASSWEMKRNGYRMDSGGDDSKIFRSFDGGNSWEDISSFNGFPKTPWGIVGIAISPKNSKRIWAMIEAKEGGLFRSDDGGNNWKKVNTNRALRQRAWYYTRIYADTQNEDKIYVMNVSYGVSKDGGKTFELKNAPHGDHHDLWIDPNNNLRMIIADDGGAQISNDGGNNWTTYYNQPTAQFYRVTTDNSFPYRIYGAQQDNSTIRIKHRSEGRSITENDWERSAGGESAHLAPDPLNNDIVYGGTYKGYMMRMDHSTNQIRSVNVWPDNPAGSGAEIMKYRFNWNFPVMFSPNNPKKLYAGSNYLHVTTNEGQTWETISGDLTRNIPETIKSSGGLITQDNTGAEFYANIFAIAESEFDDNVIWVGSDDGLIHITRDGGKSWKNITPPKSISPKLNMINSIDISPFKKGKAYVAATSYKFGDYTPYLYKTEDYGESWALITNGIDRNYYTRVIRADKKRPGLLYAGTEWGMFISFDDGNSWKSFQLNLPITSIRDLHVKENDLVVATHGRSFWVIDDLTPLHQISNEIKSAASYLFKPDLSYRIQSGWSGSASLLNGENHPNGVIINYYIKNISEDDFIKIEILDQKGNLIRSYTNNKEQLLSITKENPVLSNENDIEYALKGDNIKSLKPKSGGNRLIWDMRHPGFKAFEGMVFYSSPNVGPKAVPGKYIVKLTYNNQEMSQDFEIVKDPRLSNSQDDYKKQFDFLIDVRNEVSKANQTIINIRNLKGELEYISKKTSNKKGINTLINEFMNKLSIIENNIHMTKNQSRQDPLNYGIRINNRLAFLMADSQRGDFPPTDQAKEFFIEVKKELDKEITDLYKLTDSYISEINNLLTENQIKFLNSIN
ncbi:MAG: glycosyl hydrolase [Flavobacteriaceae bacterium]|nr:glycosyl hydrolase [Flavobacteriaceae bacterium]|tara:strand:+ start:8960 stop:12151 length:3192 start_codon:yes stop_codon:yes gene_type:complete